MYQLTLLDKQGFEVVLTASHKDTLLGSIYLKAAELRQVVVNLGEGLYRLEDKAMRHVQRVAVIEKVDLIKVSQ